MRTPRAAPAIVYRHFFEPRVADWPKGGCSGCAMVADNLCHLAHLNARDVTSPTGARRS